ncbi:hypothetical protein EK21DRAFT_107485 [Setomelanomma holmii]|uniref:Sodium/calcium exchanger membrane region domain-containing protein n=1 Tax=Setomelanomma holmii TaxID=210430 RepID=A0A9P4HGP2_9PLEO|nr:hypothetical protein EK21DRAFT_107485 [Setomelanomma holmii]
MANADVLTYNISTFIAALFLLEFGADKFIDHTAIVARRTSIPETLIGLLTAGAEWEELAVVIACLARNRTSLAIGNIVGSAISNVLGAFSLGLIFHDKDTPIEFDRSSRIYSLVLLVLTTFVTPIAYFSTGTIWLASGAVLIAFFVVYVGSVGWGISRGSLTAPEDSEDESSDDESTIDVTERTPILADQSPDVTSGSESLRPVNQEVGSSPLRRSHKTRQSLRYHLSYLFLGFLAICLAGYILSHAATTLADEFAISDVLFGVVLLSIATTLPEKFVAVVSGHRGHAGILVANTAGSNIFLLSLCLGIVMLDTSGQLERGNTNVAELSVLWGSSLAFTATVWVGGSFSRLIGAVLLIAYVVFIVLEFTVFHHIDRGN